MINKRATKPKRNINCWLDFILKDGAIPAVVEARNNSGGLYRGGRFTSWDFEGNYLAIWNQAGNAVWCHKDNLKILSRGTVKSLACFTSIKIVKDYKKLISDEVADCGMRPTYRA